MPKKKRTITRKVSWNVGTRVHHKDHGFGTIVEVKHGKLMSGYRELHGSGVAEEPIPPRVIGWKIEKDVYKRESVRYINPSLSDRAGWHLINSQTRACNCEQCRAGQTVDPRSSEAPAMLASYMEGQPKKA